MSHTLSREIAMKRLYAETVGGMETMEDAIEQSEREMLSDEDALFSDRLYEGVHAHLAEIDEEISAHAKDWSIGRIAKVFRFCALRYMNCCMRREFPSAQP